MPVGLDIANGFDEALNTAKRILSDYLENARVAWNNWKSGDPIPNIAIEKFDYSKHQAEVLINSCYNSASKGKITVVHESSGTPTVCSWDNPSIQSHINSVKDGLESMVPALNVDPSPTALLDFATIVANEIHNMMLAGNLSAGVSVGKLTGSNAILLAAIPLAFAAPSHEAIGIAIEAAFTSYCASLAGSVAGLGSGVGFILVS